MENQADQVIFEQSISDNKDVPLFQEKKYTYITDSTSNSGVFSSGQIQFDLSTFSSQSQWISLKEAVLQIPYRITGTLTTSAVGSEVSTVFGDYSATFKNGYHQIVDSCQLSINGQTIQSHQPYQNIATSFKLYSTMGSEAYNKWGPTLGLALDDCTANTQISITSTSDQSKIFSQADGLANASKDDILHPVKGVDTVSRKSQNSALNLGVLKRTKMINNAKGATNLANYILGNNVEASGMSNCASSGAINTTGDKFALFAMCTIRLKDICDIDQLPLTKNLKGYLYISFNSFKVALTGKAGGVPANNAGELNSITYTPMTGRTCPFNIIDSNISDVGTPEPDQSVSGFVIGAGSSTAPVVEFTGTVSGQQLTTPVGNSAPVSSNARMFVPYYIANPKVDDALSMTKTFSTLEKIVNPIKCEANKYVSYTITVGVPNPRKLVLVPFYENLRDLSETAITNLDNPEFSPWDCTPATTSVFAYLRNLQVSVANKPIFNYPLDYSYEHWIAENSGNGLNGNADDELTSGLLSQQLWEQNHRFYSIDLSRRVASMDGQSQSVQVSFQNGSANYNMKVIAIVFYEKKWQINTATCQIQSA